MLHQLRLWRTGPDPRTGALLLSDPEGRVMQISKSCFSERLGVMVAWAPGFQLLYWIKALGQSTRMVPKGCDWSSTSTMYFVKAEQ